MTNQYGNININAPRATAAIAADTTLDLDADLVIVNTVGAVAAITATLPDARGVDGLQVIIKAPVATVGGGGQNVIVAGTGGQTIDGNASITLAVDQTSLCVKSDNANWRIVCLTDADSGGEIIFGDLFLDAASPTLTDGNGTGSPKIVLNKANAGIATFDLNNVGITRWDITLDASEDFLIQRRNGAGVLVDVPFSMTVADGNITMPNVLAVAQVTYAVVVVGDAGSQSLGAEKLIQATAPTGLTTLNLPTAVVGDEYFIDAVDITAGIAVTAAAGDTINGGAVAGTATISTLGLYHIYAVTTTDWRLHGPIALGPASA